MCMKFYILTVIFLLCKTREMATVLLSENNNQRHIEIAVNDIIQIELDESPTAGYGWEITELNGNNLQIISEDFKINANAGIGGGRKKIIELKVLRKATESTKLEYRRRWKKRMFIKGLRFPIDKKNLNYT